MNNANARSSGTKNMTDTAAIKTQQLPQQDVVAAVR
ncbi:hypothetical protein J2S01_002089 [Pectinatus haikarae]|uniref:Uncharacterized protein n=1 Tax=Pectinatus haikarae TaxID=349096 RepID=A0ABT9YA02_9FIRM|nr:hypothetical protein [Pectinatus haikarae]